MKSVLKLLLCLAVAIAVLAACSPGARSRAAPVHGEFANRIAVDSRGRVWVDEGHLYRAIWTYDGTQWSEVATPESARIDLSGMREIVADGGGHVYALANNNCWLFQNDDATWEALIEDCRGSLGIMTAIVADPNGRLWIAATWAEGSTRISSITAFDSPDFGRYTLPNVSWATMVDDLVLGTHGILWAGTYDGELLALDTSSWATNPLVASVVVSNEPIAELAVDGADRVWVGGVRGGLYLAEDGNVTELWPTTDNNGNMVDVIEIDAAGRIWVVGPDCAQLEDCKGPGITIFDGESSRRFTRENSTLPTNGVNDLAFDGSGRVWLATRSGVFVMPVADLLGSPAGSSPGG
jgi:ligand-binding sensor domain-containing protein